jgi:hypothetical protein
MTADTVILYDSDWNPQVDLQAMDRAHRIGQKNTVMVYRLICDNTVEEKMIERQQVKLKWDQLVILKGRIAQKNNKIEKDELKNLISFGANEIFRSKEGTFKDEDIEALLKRGLERTGQLNKKIDEIVNKNKDQILNLEFNNINLYEFMGQEIYQTNQDQAALENIWEKENFEQKYSKRIGKYGLGDGNKIIINSESFEEIENKKVIKVYDFQYFSDKNRIEELLNQEKVLTEEEKKEKLKIEKRGFKNWNKADFFLFIKTVENQETKDVKEISEKLKKEVNDVEKFYKRFIDEMSFLQDEKKIKERFQKAEKQRLFKKKVNLVLKEKLYKITSADDIILKSQFYNKIKNKNYEQIHDKYIIFYSGKFGFDNVEKISKSLRYEPKFRFDIFIKTIKDNLLVKRINSLMKMLINEFNYIKEYKEKFFKGGKLTYNCYIMGFNKVLEEGIEKDRVRKEELKKKKKEEEERYLIAKKREEEERKKIQKELIKRSQLSKNEKKKKIKESKTKAQPKNQNSHQLSSGYEHNPIDSNYPPAFLNSIYINFIKKTIQKMKSQNYTFTRQETDFPPLELTLQFLKIPQISNDPELTNFLPEKILSQLRALINQNSNVEEKKTTPDQHIPNNITFPGNHKNMVEHSHYNNTPSHINQTVVYNITPNSSNPYSFPQKSSNDQSDRNFNSFGQTMNQYQQQHMQPSPVSFSQIQPRNSNPMYISNIKNINNIKNVNNIYMRPYNEMMMPGNFQQNNEEIFNRHYPNKNIPLINYSAKMMEKEMELRRMQQLYQQRETMKRTHSKFTEENNN